MMGEFYFLVLLVIFMILFILNIGFHVIWIPTYPWYPQRNHPWFIRPLHKPLPSLTHPATR